MEETEESGEDRYTRNEEDRTSENEMERSLPTRHEKYRTESGRRTGRCGVGRLSVIRVILLTVGKARAKEKEVYNMVCFV